MGRPRLDIAGERYGRLLAVEIAFVDARQAAHWLCHCDCGKQTIVRLSDMRYGRTRSCGCLRVDHGRSRRTHGGKGTRLYRIWHCMKGRCYRPADVAYSRYGGRGIHICGQWLHDFGAFRDWALPAGYRDDLTIDRIDNDRGYEPGNCRWATYTEQNNNKRPRQVA